VSIQVTQGSGTTIATVIKAAANHQRVMVHETHMRALTVTAGLQTLNNVTPYTPGIYMGGEWDFLNAFRGAPEPQPILYDSARLEGISLLLTGNQAPFALDIVILAKALLTTPVDQGTPQLAAGEDLTSIQQIVSVPAGAWVAGLTGTTKMAFVVPPLPTVVAEAGAPSGMLRAAVICRSSIAITGGANCLSMAALFKQD
jgi:hypothetical protein